MFNLTESITHWRQTLAANGTYRPQDLDELESHLCEEIDRLVPTGLSQEEAFFIAVRRLGDTQALTCEFAKIDPGAFWRDRVFWMAAGVLSYLLIGAVSQLISSLGGLTGMICRLNPQWLGTIAAATNIGFTLFVFFMIYRVLSGKMPRIHGWLKSALTQTNNVRRLSLLGMLVLLVISYAGKQMVWVFMAKTLTSGEMNRFAYGNAMVGLVWGLAMPVFFAVLLACLYPRKAESS